MSDEPIPLPTEAERQHTGPFVHYCEHEGCKTWGGFGFSRGKSVPARWYCGEHKAEGERHL